jgi:hypothetical protein
MTIDREDSIFRAKIAEQAERFDGTRDKQRNFYR